MTDVTDRLGLPMLAAGQAQKELFHNEALALIDLVLGAGVEAVGVNAPPASPLAGQAWVAGPAPTGTWAGHANAIAGWTAGGWRFVSPREGLAVWSVADGAVARWRGGRWEPSVQLGPRRAAIAGPNGGGVVDTESRAAIEAILGALRGHGVIGN